MRKRGSEEVPQRGRGRRRGHPPDILTRIVEGSDKVRYRPALQAGHRQSYAAWRWQRGAGPGSDSQCVREGRSCAAPLGSGRLAEHKLLLALGAGTAGTRASE